MLDQQRLSTLDAKLHIVRDRIRGVAATVRVGISKAVEQPWRFLDPDSPYVSRRPRRAA